MSKALNYLGIARKSGGIETGEDNSSGLVKAGKARVLLVASDTSDGAKRRAEGYVYETNTILVETPFTKDEIAGITGKSGCSMAAITDLGLAAAFLKALADEQPEIYSESYESIKALQQRLEKRKTEKSKSVSGKKTGIRRKKSV